MPFPSVPKHSATAQGVLGGHGTPGMYSFTPYHVTESTFSPVDSTASVQDTIHEQMPEWTWLAQALRAADDGKVNDCDDDIDTLLVFVSLLRHTRTTRWTR